MKPYLEYQITKGLLNVSSKGGLPLLTDCYAAVQLSSGETYTTKAIEAKVKQFGSGCQVLCPVDKNQPELAWTIELEEDGLAMRLRLGVRNTTDWALAIERLDVLISPAGFRQEPALTLKAGQTGWQSWSPASPAVLLSTHLPNAPPPIIGPMLPSTEADRILAPWMTLLSTQSEENLLIGFISAHNYQGIVSIQPSLDGHRFIASSHAEGTTLRSGETLHSESLLLVFEN